MIKEKLYVRHETANLKQLHSSYNKAERIQRDLSSLWWFRAPAKNFYVKQTCSIMHFHCIKYWRREVRFKSHAPMQRCEAQCQNELETQCTGIKRLLPAACWRVMRTHRWICPFLWRYSSPSRTSLKMVAMLASSNTPVLCSPREMVCLMMSKTEPTRQAQACHQMCWQYM